MITLRDGPVAGKYMVKVAPQFLRAVITVGGNDKDVLDQPGDEPHSYERIHIYRRIGEAGFVHLNMGGRNNYATRDGYATGFYAHAEYEHMPNVDGERFRETVTWQRWAEEAEAGRV